MEQRLYNVRDINWQRIDQQAIEMTHNNGPSLPCVAFTSNPAVVRDPVVVLDTRVVQEVLHYHHYNSAICLRIKAPVIWPLLDPKPRTLNDRTTRLVASVWPYWTTGEGPARCCQTRAILITV